MIKFLNEILTDGNGKKSSTRLMSVFGAVFIAFPVILVWSYLSIKQGKMIEIGNGPILTAAIPFALKYFSAKLENKEVQK